MKKSVFPARVLACVIAVSAVFLLAWAGMRPSGTWHVMSYNIADGMWYDQYDGYDSFVDWVSGKDPDVLALCECATHWDKEKKNIPGEQGLRYLPDGLPELAKRWGHRHTAIGPYQDNYPVAITSRYPVTTVQRIGDGLSHGALHVRIKGINFVVLHLWPHWYSKTDKERKGGGGDAFRVMEITAILDSTINNPEFSSEKNWVFMGDFNSFSPSDSAYFPGRSYEVHRLMLSAGLHDIIGEMNSGVFVPSENREKYRIDYIYCSDSIWEKVLRSETIKDGFTLKASDHRPLEAEFTYPRK